MKVIVTLGDQTSELKPDGKNAFSGYIRTPNAITAQDGYANIKVYAESDSGMDSQTDGSDLDGLQLHVSHFIAVTDRTAYDVQQQNRKGTYTFTDMNRVGADVTHVSQLLADAGKGAFIDAKRDWRMDDEPTSTELATYLGHVSAVRSAAGVSVPLPASIERMDFEDANNIERVLVEAERKVNA